MIDHGLKVWPADVGGDNQVVEGVAAEGEVPEIGWPLRWSAGDEGLAEGGPFGIRDGCSHAGLSGCGLEGLPARVEDGVFVADGGADGAYSLDVGPEETSAVAGHEGGAVGDDGLIAEEAVEGPLPLRLLGGDVLGDEVDSRGARQVLKGPDDHDHDHHQGGPFAGEALSEGVGSGKVPRDAGCIFEVFRPSTRQAFFNRPRSTPPSMSKNAAETKTRHPKNSATRK